MSVELTEAKIKFRDSLNFLPMPLKALPKTLNRQENQCYVGPLPPIENYDPDARNTKEREEFLRWHQELTRAEYVFNFET